MANKVPRFRLGDVVAYHGHDRVVATIYGPANPEYRLISPDAGYCDFVSRKHLVEYPQFISIPRKKRWLSLRSRVREGRATSGEYTFRCLLSPDLKRVIITAGCRIFSSFDKARAWWTGRVRWTGRGEPWVSANAALNARSLAIIDAFEADLKALRKAKRARKGATKPARGKKR